MPVGGQPESGHMARTVLLLIHNVELDAMLRLPLHVLKQALVDEHLEGAQHAGRKNQNEVTLCGGKTAASATTGRRASASTTGRAQEPG